MYLLRKTYYYCTIFHLLIHYYIISTKAQSSKSIIPSDGTSFNHDVDEKNGCPLGTFSCHVAQCVPQSLICNGIPDCLDKSDEIGCGITQHEKKYWDHYFPPKPGKDEDGSDEIIGESSSNEHRVCKYDVELIQYPSVSFEDEHSTGLTLAGCQCIWEKFRCNNLHLQNLSIVPWDVEYLDLSGSVIILLDFNSPPAFPKLEHLILSGCSISEISFGGFYHLGLLKTLHLTGNKIPLIPSKAFSTNKSLQKLFLGYNLISELEESAFVGLSQLEELDLRHNKLTGTEPNVYKHLENLRILHLNGNKFREISQQHFVGLSNLEILSLSSNLILSIPPKAFTHLSSLKSLYLSRNQIQILSTQSFTELPKLIDLHLNHNKISFIEEYAFSGLQELESLNLKKNRLSDCETNIQTFENLTKLQHIYFDEFWMCGWALHVRHCEPKGDGISSVQNLLDNVVLRICVWIMGILGILGNCCVIVSRLVFREPNPVHSFYIKNLAFADLLMGLFLISIAIHDVKFRGKFITFSHTWRNSYTCQLSGVLSTWSSEASVLILALITMDRYMSIVRPFAERSTSIGIAIGLVGILWVLSFILSYLPISGFWSNYFTHFYTTNGLCQIHNPYDKGWEYSFALFVILNTVVFLFIFYAYWKMFEVIQRSSVMLRTNQEKQDGVLAKRFSLVVLTDFLCWGTVIVTKLIAMLGISIHTNLYAWLAVFALPINSALNPIIYSFTTKIFRQQMAKFTVGWWKWGRRRGQLEDSTAASLSLFSRVRAQRQTIASVLPSSQPGSRKSHVHIHIGGAGNNVEVIDQNQVMLRR